MSILVAHCINLVDLDTEQILDIKWYIINFGDNTSYTTANDTDSLTESLKVTSDYLFNANLGELFRGGFVLRCGRGEGGNITPHPTPTPV